MRRYLFLFLAVGGLLATIGSSELTRNLHSLNVATDFSLAFLDPVVKSDLLTALTWVLSVFGMLVSISGFFSMYRSGRLGPQPEYR